MEEVVRGISVEIGERNVPNYPALIAAAKHLEDTLTSYGYQVVRHPFMVSGREVWNIEVQLIGDSLPPETIVIGCQNDQ